MSVRISRETVNNMREINKFRKQIELPPIESQIRTCLRCGRQFKSASAANRLCGCKA